MVLGWMVGRVDNGLTGSVGRGSNGLVGVVNLRSCWVDL